MITDHIITVVSFSSGKIVVSLVVGSCSRRVISAVIGLGSVMMSSSVVVMSGIKAEKCSNCSEMGIGLKANPWSLVWLE